MKLIKFFTDHNNIGIVYVNPEHVSVVHEDLKEPGGDVVLTIGGNKQVPVMGTLDTVVNRLLGIEL